LYYIYIYGVFSFVSDISIRLYSFFFSCRLFIAIFLLQYTVAVFAQHLIAHSFTSISHLFALLHIHIAFVMAAVPPEEIGTYVRRHILRPEECRLCDKARFARSHYCFSHRCLWLGVVQKAGEWPGGRIAQRLLHALDLVDKDAKILEAERDQSLGNDCRQRERGNRPGPYNS
jgi:hypothetical protein